MLFQLEPSGTVGFVIKTRASRHVGTGQRFQWRWTVHSVYRSNLSVSVRAEKSSFTALLHGFLAASITTAKANAAKKGTSAAISGLAFLVRTTVPVFSRNSMDVCWRVKFRQRSLLCNNALTCGFYIRSYGEIFTIAFGAELPTRTRILSLWTPISPLQFSELNKDLIYFVRV